MKIRPKVSVVFVFVIAAVVALSPSVRAQGGLGPPTGVDQTDHMLLPDTEVGYCGLEKNAEPWTLSITASGVNPTTSSPGLLTIEFRDGDAITFKIPPNSAISLTQQMGGVPGVDDLVRITVSPTSTQAVHAWVSARARPNATDPFIEPGAPEADNLCVNLTDEGPIDTLLAVPDSWVTDTVGANGGTLQ